MPTGCNSSDEELSQKHMEYVVALERGRHFNGLKPEVAELLAILAEECGAVTQRVGKILRHGLRTNPYDPEGDTNVSKLEEELADIEAICSLLHRLDVLNTHRIVALIGPKLEKLRRPDILHHSSLLSPRPCCVCHSTGRIQYAPGEDQSIVECVDRDACADQVRAWEEYCAINADILDACPDCFEPDCYLPHGRGCP